VKAQDLLRRYAAGERNFCNANLEGENFKGQDLSGVDFSGADIRGANFSDATLRDANFSNAQVGMARRWANSQGYWIAILAGLSGVMQGFGGAFAISIFFDGSTDSFVIGCVYVLLVIAIFLAIAFYGFRLRAFCLIMLAAAIAFTVALTGPFSIPLIVAVTVAVASTVIGAVTSGALAFAGTFTSAFVGTLIGAVIGALPVVLAIAFTLAFARESDFVLLSFSAVAVTGAIASALIALSLNVFVAQQVRRENAKFVIARRFGLALTMMGSTSFRGADLTGASFDQELLESTYFTNSRPRQPDTRA
jgi:hypothetical protein